MKKFGNLLPWGLAALLAAAPIISAAPARAQFASQATYGVGGGPGNAQNVTIPNVSSLADVLGVPISIQAGAPNTGSTTLSVSSTTPTIVKKPSPAGLVNMVGGEIKTGQIYVVMYDGLVYEFLSPPAPIPPTFTNLLVGSGSYVPPSGVVRIKVRMIAAGGGGAGCPGGTSGGVGGTTVFGPFTVIGGGGGTDCGSTGLGGPGGTGGSGLAVLRIPGGNGHAGGIWDTSSGAMVGPSAAGCGSVFGGAGYAIRAQANGGAAVPNTGSGGGAGAYFGGANDTRSGGGGGCGEYAEAMIPTPGTIAYSVGTPGAASTGGSFQGAFGASGAVYIEEQYQ